MLCTLNIQVQGKTVTKTVPATEYDVWKEIASLLPEIPLDEPLSDIVAQITETGEETTLHLAKRGSFVKNGISYPSLYVTVSGKFALPHGAVYPECYLTCVNPESNNYKYYHMNPTPAGIEVDYGRIGAVAGDRFGAKKLANPYPDYLYWVRYYEKLSKGYTDQSDVYLSPKAKTVSRCTSVPKCTGSKSVSEILYDQLRTYAKRVVKENLVNQNITEKQISQSKRIFAELGRRKTVKGFNSQLMRLLAISPRRCSDVKCLLAQTVNDFKSIVEREDRLIKAMEVLTGKTVSAKEGCVREGFASFGIEVFEATPKQVEEVKKHLSASLQSKIKNIYRVIDKKKKARFDAYLKDDHIKKVKCFWHGSRNENWLSIILNGLKLNPNAVITGKMFGQGIYFASSSDKSWGYTSYHGTRWARGTQNTAFMGLYATAYGNPYDVTCAGNYSQRFLDAQHKNCVHALAGSQLYNDEVVFYDEDAVLLNYIVEFI